LDETLPHRPLISRTASGLKKVLLALAQVPVLPSSFSSSFYWTAVWSHLDPS